MKFKHEYHYVPKELITNEAIHSAVVYALECAGGVVDKSFGAYEDRYRDSKGLSISDSTRILWSSCFATEPVTLQQLFNHEDFEWPEGMGKIGYLRYGSVVFYGAKGYSFIHRNVGYDQPEYEWHPFNHKPTGITLIATKESQEENMNKEFTKDMLVAGKHVVEYRDGYLRLVLETNEGLGLSGSDGHMRELDDYENNLTNPCCDAANVVKVYTLKSTDVLRDILDSGNLNLIWERKEKSQQEIEYESLIQKIAELEAQARKLKP